MKRGIALLDSRVDKTRAPVIVFLTDGDPTVGETRTTRLLQMVKRHNEDQVPIFSLAFGKGADFGFLKKMSAQNDGFARKIYEESDADLQISKFYSEISSVLLQDVTFTYLNGAVDQETLTSVYMTHFFDGSELVVAGRLTNELTDEIAPSVLAFGTDGMISLVVPPDRVVSYTTELNITQDSDIYAITEKLWAYLTIKQWQQKMDATTDEREQDSLKQNITTLALQVSLLDHFS